MRNSLLLICTPYTIQLVVAGSSLKNFPVFWFRFFSLPHVVFIHNMLTPLITFPFTAVTQTWVLTPELFNQYILIPPCLGVRHSGQSWAHKDGQALEGSKEKITHGRISIQQCKKDINSGFRERMTVQVSQGIFREECHLSWALYVEYRFVGLIDREVISRPHGWDTVLNMSFHTSGDLTALQCPCDKFKLLS